MADLQPSINANAQAPKSVDVDGTSAEQQPLPDQIQADRYLKTNQAAGGPKRGLIFARFRHQGTVGQD